MSETTVRELDLVEQDGPWVAEHAEKQGWARALAPEIRRHPGEYVALAAGRLVAHDPDFLALMTTLEERGVDDPYLIAVPATPAVAR